MPGGYVSDPHRGVGRVDALPARAGGAIDVDPEVVGVDRDIDVLGLRQDKDARGRGVDPALRLGGRYPLHAVDAALVLEPGERRLTGLRGPARLDRDGDVLVAAEVGLLGVEQLGLPAPTLGVAEVHPQQVPGEQRRLVAPLTRLDLEDDVAVVVRVARDQQVGELLGELLAPCGQLGGLHDERRVLAAQLHRGVQVRADREPLLVGRHQRGQLGEATAEPPRGALVGVDRRVGELRLEVRVLTDQIVDLLEHGTSLGGRTAAPAPAMRTAPLPEGTAP